MPKLESRLLTVDNRESDLHRFSSETSGSSRFVHKRAHRPKKIHPSTKVARPASSSTQGDWGLLEPFSAVVRRQFIAGQHGDKH